MKSYSETEIFTPRELDYWATATGLVKEIEWGISDDIRCHELAEAVGTVLGLTRQDGHFFKVQHSWLWTRAPGEAERDTWPAWSHYNRPKILDVYTPGGVPMVQLRDTFWALNPGAAYRIGTPDITLCMDTVRGLVSRLLIIGSALWPQRGWQPFEPLTEHLDGDSPTDPSGG